MILPFPDIKAQQKQLASKFIKDSRASFAGKKKSGYLLITWSDKDDVNVALYDSKEITLAELEAYVDASLAVIDAEMEE
jgi:hypothetical protein